MASAKWHFGSRAITAVSHLPPNRSFRKLPWHEAALRWIFSETRGQPPASRESLFALPRAP
jgi:hypothetical protein